MDQPIGKPPGKRGVLGQESQDDRARVDNVSSDKDEARGSAFVNDGQLYDDSEMSAGSGADGGSLYDTFGTSPESVAGAGKLHNFVEREPESDGAERTLFDDSEILPEAGAGGHKESDVAGESAQPTDGAREPQDDPGAPGQSEAAKGGGMSPGPNQTGRRRKSSAASNGSCPSWLKSGLYKGDSSSEDSEKVVELQEQVILNSPIGTAIIDNRGNIRLSNSAFNHAIGLEADESAKDIDQVGEQVRDVDITNRFWDAVESGSDLKIEDSVYIVGRGKAKLRAIFQPVTFSTGTSWCICYFESVDSSGPSRNHLWEYQNYVACVATSSGDAIVGLDMDGNVKYWNQGAQALFGYTDDEIVGQPLMQLVPEELRREAQLVLKVVTEQGIYKNYDTSRVHKNGRRIPVTMTVTAVRNEDGEMMGTAATLKDLRTSKDLHEKALEAEKLNAVLQMAVTVYHQINNPLCVIAANSQLLLTRIKGGDSEEAKKLESILEATKRISTVLEDLGRLTGVEPQITTPRDKK